MYNESVKQQYLKKCSKGASNILEFLFRKSEDIESNLNKDICCFNRKEVDRFLLSLKSISITTIAGYISLLNLYTKNCNELGLNQNNVFASIKRKQMYEYLDVVAFNNAYLSQKELLQLIDSSILNAVDKYILLGLFEGLYGEQCEELTGVTAEAVDWKNHIIKLDSRALPCSSRLCEYARNACDEYEYFMDGNEHMKEYKLNPNDATAFKPRVNASYLYGDQWRIQKRLTARLTKLRKETGCKALTIKGLRTSGILSEIKTIQFKYGLGVNVIFDSKEFESVRAKYQIEHQPAFQLKAKYGKMM